MRETGSIVAHRDGIVERWSPPHILVGEPGSQSLVVEADIALAEVERRERIRTEPLRKVDGAVGARVPVVRTGPQFEGGVQSAAWTCAGSTGGSQPGLGYRIAPAPAVDARRTKRI